MRHLNFAGSRLLKYPWTAYTVFRRMRHYNRGRLLRTTWEPVNTTSEAITPVAETDAPVANPLEQYFDTHTAGRGIWKWRHYFDIYHRHFQKFIGREVHVMEIGVFSGGSLDMWKYYFGPACTVYGVDIQSECKAYEGDRTKIFIGDQADRRFWRDVLKKIPRLDVIIDDGGHLPEQQVVTLEETLPALSPGGVYLCEDVHATNNCFASYIYGLSDGLNEWRATDREILASGRSPFQRYVHSVHLYPFVVVIERAVPCQGAFEAPKHGTEWQPFLRF